MPFSIEPTGLPRRAGVFSVRGLGLAALLVMPLALGGCSMFGGDDEAVDVVEKDAPKPCPTVGVLDGADHVTLFNGRGKDLTDVVLRAEIRKSVLQCEYDSDNAEISVNVAFDGTVDLGPAATSREANIPGFIAIVRHGYMVSKQPLDIPVQFEGAARTVKFLKTIEDTKIPIGGELNGAAYEVIVGFQVTKDELDYNKKVPSTPLR